jgi:hypothetical protein
VRDGSWPLRKSDAFFVVAVVLFILPDPASGWSFSFPSTAIRLGLVVAVVSAWIRFRVFGRSD